MIATSAPSDDEIRNTFIEMLPELSSRLSRRFGGRHPDLREEMVAEGVALSWQNFRNASRKGKQLTASNVCWAAGKAALSGRRLAGSCSTDALSNGHHGPDLDSALASVERDGRGFYRTFGDRRWRWPIWCYVSAKLDWADFHGRLPQRDRLLLDLKLAGMPQTRIAAVFGVTPARVSQLLSELRRQWRQLGAA